MNTKTSLFQDASACPYFKDGRVSTIEYFLPGSNETLHFHEYLAMGYRRIGRIFYRNACTNCTDCLPVRIETDTFHLSKSHRRTVKKNNDIEMTISYEPSLSLEKIALYKKYVNSKHGEKEHTETSDPTDVLLSMHYGYAYTIEMNYYCGDTLIGVGITDKGKDALSSNYFYYDTDYLERRLGIFSILQEISLAKSLGLKYYYLGFYIEDNPKMSYKKYFRPNQVLKNGKWRDFLSH